MSSAAVKATLLILAGMFLFSLGCATVSPGPVMLPKAPTAEKPTPPSHVPIPEKPERSKQPSPQTLASLRLTEQARLLIESKRPDDAIRILERALNLDPSNGQNYYYLAEAWLQKNNKTQAREFNRIAGIYLNDEADWMTKVWRQKERIEIK